LNSGSDDPAYKISPKLAVSFDYPLQNGQQLAASPVRQTGDWLTIVAPYGGAIAKRNIETGSFVGHTSDKPLIELEDMQSLSLRVPVPEVYTSAALSGNSCEGTKELIPGTKIVIKFNN
jgi:hypothetical protein